MCKLLEILQSDYRALLLHGIVPTGIVVSSDDLSSIQETAAAGDKRILWDQTGAVERMFGFAPTVAEVDQPRFTTSSHPWPDPHALRRYTLDDVRAL